MSQAAPQICRCKGSQGSDLLDGREVRQQKRTHAFRADFPGTAVTATATAGVVDGVNIFTPSYKRGFQVSINTFHEQRGGGGRGGGGGGAARLSLLVLFSLFSRPRAGFSTVKSIFWGLATNTLNVRNNNNNNY